MTFKRAFLAVAQPENHGDESGRDQFFVAVCGMMCSTRCSPTRVTGTGCFFFVRCCVRRAVSWRDVEIEGWTAFDSVICVAIEGPQDQGHVVSSRNISFLFDRFHIPSKEEPLFCDRQIEFQGQDVYLEHASSLLSDGHHLLPHCGFHRSLLALTGYCSLLPFKLLRLRRGRVRSGIVSGCAEGHEDV